MLSNLYLDEVDRMLERAKEVTRYGRFTAIEYARFADGSDTSCPHRKPLRPDGFITLDAKCAERVVREIRMLRAMRRGLETGSNG